MVKTRAVYLALGVNLEGEKERLGRLRVSESEGAKFWLSVFNELKKPRDRGVLHCLRGRAEGSARCH
jgi:putative transposase